MAAAPKPMFALDPASMDAFCEALLPRLLPALQSAVEQAAAKAASQALQAFKAESSMSQGATILGAVPPRQSLTVDWTFTNSGSEIWPVGCRLRSVAGNLAATGTAKVSEVATPLGGHLTLQASMVAPGEPGPCEAQWQLESPEGAPLSPPMVVKGMVLSASTKSVPSALNSKPISQTPAKTIPTGDAASLQQRGPETPIRKASGIITTGPSSQTGPGAVNSVVSSQTGQVHSVQPSLQKTLSSGTERWLQLFESFFGKEVHQPGGKERMVNQVWEYVRSKQLLRVQDHAYVFDPLLQQLFAPIMQPGASHCPAGDLLPLVHRLLARFNHEVQRR